MISFIVKKITEKYLHGSLSKNCITYTIFIDLIKLEKNYLTNIHKMTYNLFFVHRPRGGVSAKWQLTASHSQKLRTGYVLIAIPR